MRLTAVDVSTIFISYRRDDTAPYAGRIYDRLTAHFGDSQVFMDIDQIQPGEDFVKVINSKVSACDVAIVLIGKNWLALTNAEGKRRLDDAEDFVRLEVAAALARDVRVVPVLVGGTAMPRANELPEVLAPLARRNAVEVSDTRFHSDVDRLLEALGKPKPSFSTRWLVAGGGAVAALVALAIGVRSMVGSPPQDLAQGVPHKAPAASTAADDIVRKAGEAARAAEKQVTAAVQASAVTTPADPPKKVVQVDTDAAARALLAQFVKPDADHRALTLRLKPTKVDYEAVFELPFAATLQAAYEPMWQSGEAVIKGRPDQTEVLIRKISSAEARNWSPEAKNELPGGYERIAADIKPGHVFYIFSFVTPGERLGIRYDVLVQVNGQWRFFPKPWRAKKTE